LVGVIGSSAWVVTSSASRRLSLRGGAVKRAHEAELVALQAAEQDAAFAPEELRGAVDEIIAVADAWWSSRDSAVLSRREDGGYLEAWARSRAEYVGRDVRLAGPPDVDVLQVVNRAGRLEDRVVVRVRWHAHRANLLNATGRRHPGVGRTVKLDERWTLGRGKKGWVLLSAEGPAVSATLLRAPLIAEASADEGRMREEGLTSLAAEPRAVSAKLVGKLTAFEGRAALLDLSVIDPRFMPDLLQASVEHVIQAWEQATVGDAEALRALASEPACAALLEPCYVGAGGSVTMVDVVLKRWTCKHVLADAAPARVKLDVEIEAIRYETDVSGLVLGDDRAAQTLRLEWTLQAGGSAAHPWQLIASSPPHQPYSDREAFLELVRTRPRNTELEAQVATMLDAPGSPLNGRQTVVSARKALAYVTEQLGERHGLEQALERVIVDRGGWREGLKGPERPGRFDSYVFPLLQKAEQRSLPKARQRPLPNESTVGRWIHRRPRK
jgi:hypothetical protein